MSLYWYEWEWERERIVLVWGKYGTCEKLWNLDKEFTEVFYILKFKFFFKFLN